MIKAGQTTSTTGWLFSRRQDLFLLGAPVALTLCGFVAATWIWSERSSDVTRQTLWLSQFLLGNSTHVVLTFVLLYLRRDVLNATPGQARITLTGSAVVFILAFCMFWLSRREYPWFLHFATAVAICFATHHTLSQVRGFWSLYSMQTQRAGGLAVSQMERSLFQWLVPLGLFLILVRWFFVPGSQTATTPFFPVANGQSAPLAYATWMPLLGVWAVYGVLLLTALRPWKQGRIGAPKVAYVSAHLLAVSLALSNPILGAVLSGALHGVEYILLCARMMGRADSLEQGLADRFVIPVLVVSMLPLFLIGLTAAPFIQKETAAAHELSFGVALMVLNSLVLAHYFADACIYKFRVPAVRAVALRRLRFSN
jgi:hypothetical protein